MGISESGLCVVLFQVSVRCLQLLPLENGQLLTMVSALSSSQASSISIKQIHFFRSMISCRDGAILAPLFSSSLEEKSASAEKLAKG